MFVNSNEKGGGKVPVMLPFNVVQYIKQPVKNHTYSSMTKRIMLKKYKRGNMLLRCLLQHKNVSPRYPRLHM